MSVRKKIGYTFELRLNEIVFDFDFSFCINEKFSIHTMNF